MEAATFYTYEYLPYKDKTLKYYTSIRRYINNWPRINIMYLTYITLLTLHYTDITLPTFTLLIHIKLFSSRSTLLRQIKVILKIIH